MANVFLTDIKREVALDTGISQSKVEMALRSAFNKIGDHLANGNKVYLIDFVNFEPKDYAAKRTKHPQTGEELIIPPYRAISCAPSAALKAKLKAAKQNEQ